MGSIRNIAASTPMPNDLAQKIGVHGVNEILDVLWQAYHALINDPSVKIDETTNEDDITQLWFAKVLLLWDGRNRATSVTLNRLIPMHQYADTTMRTRPGTKAPTIDFCFKDWSTTNSYFGAEAKNLYKDKADKIKRYVETGVKNYTSGRYGSQSSESSIIGYVLSGRIPDIVDKLRIEMLKVHPSSNLTRIMTKSDPEYQSRHFRTLDKKDIILHHLFFDFVA